jgi:hypothetical protein
MIDLNDDDMLDGVPDWLVRGATNWRAERPV